MSSTCHSLIYGSVAGIYRVTIFRHIFEHAIFGHVISARVDTHIWMIVVALFNRNIRCGLVVLHTAQRETILVYHSSQVLLNWEEHPLHFLRGGPNKPCLIIRSNRPATVITTATQLLQRHKHIN